MRFYARFQDEVIADPAAIAAHVARARDAPGSERKALPGFAEGYGLIAADKQRHIACGTWFLR